MRRISSLEILGLLMIMADLVSGATQICQDPDNNAYTTISCGPPGKDGPPGPAGFPGQMGPKGEPGISCGASDELQQQIKNLIERVKKLDRNSRKKSVTITSKRFFSYGDLGNFDQAEAMCKKEGAVVASPQTFPENNALLGVSMHFGGYAFLGLTDRIKEGTFLLPSGKPTNYTYWNKGEPNNYDVNENCVELWDRSGLWNDAYCGLTRLIICELPLA